MRVSVDFTISPDPLNLDVEDTQLPDGQMVTGYVEFQFTDEY